MNLKKLLFQLKKEFAKIEKVSAVFLYGSYARGDYSEKHSDFDLFILMDMKKVSDKIREKIDNTVIPLGIKHRVRIHTEYQGTGIKPEDQTLITKMIEEGKLIYCSGLFIIPAKKMGLDAFFLYEFKGNVRLSQILHGRKAWYYKGKEKIVKEYKGLIDNEVIIGAGRGALLVRKDRSEAVEGMFKSLGIKYRIKKILYG